MLFCMYPKMITVWCALQNRQTNANNMIKFQAKIQEIGVFLRLGYRLEIYLDSLFSCPSILASFFRCFRLGYILRADTPEPILKLSKVKLTYTVLIVGFIVFEGVRHASILITISGEQANTATCPSLL